MKAYKIFIKDRDALIRQTMEDSTKYNPIKDHNGDYFIFEQEFIQCGLGVLTEYVPPTPPEII